MFFSYESYVLMSSPFREIITLVLSSDAARNVPTLLITHYSQLKNMSLLFFCQKISQLTTYRSSLKSRCRFPSLQTADVCGTSEYHGFKNPRLFALSGIASFRRHTFRTRDNRELRLEDAKLNSRGLSSPWKQ